MENEIVKFKGSQRKVSLKCQIESTVMVIMMMVLMMLMLYI